MDIKMFIKRGCPYCAQAESVITELSEEHPEYKDIKIMRIDENAEPELADSYDYWYVPSFFVNNEKKYEGSAMDSRKKVKKVINSILSDALSNK